MLSKNKRINSYRGVLKNKSLVKIMEAGLHAPLGSTQRRKAQKMLSIIKKTSMDGAGGPGPQIPRVNVQLKPVSYNYSDFLILPATPKIRVPFGEKPPTPKPIHDGAGGPGYTPPVLGMPSSSSGYTGQISSGVNPGGNYYEGLVKPVGSYLGGHAYNAVTSPYKTAANSLLGLGKGIQGGLQGVLEPVNNRMTALPGLATANSTAQAVNLPQQPQQQQTSAAKPVFGVPGDTPKYSSSSTAYGSQALKNLMTPPAGATTPGAVAPGATTPGAVAPGVVAPGTETSPLNKFQSVQDAVDSGIGSSMFAFDALSKGGDYLKTIPGFENLPSNLLNGGATLSGRLKTVDDALRVSYNLDEMLNSYTEMVNNGVGLEGRLTDYIRGRDEFLNETNDMISNLKRKTMKMDMSDPRTQANVNQHLNYMYEMRGRQNKRYIEFLKMSTDSYTQQVTAAENLYNNQFAHYEREFNYKANITKEEYEMMFNGLTGIYDSVAAAPAREWELLKLQQEYDKTNLQMMIDMKELNGATSGDIVTLNNDLKKLNVLDADGRWRVNDSALTLGATSPNEFVNIMSDAVYAALAIPDKEGRLPDAGQMQLIIGNALGHLANLYSAGAISQETYEQRKADIKNKGNKALSTGDSFINSADIPSYKKAIKAISGINTGFAWFDGEPVTLEKLLADYPSLNSGVLRALYTDMLGFKAAGQTPKAWGDTFSTSAGELGQGGAAVDDSAFRYRLVEAYTRKLQAQEIVGTPSFNQVGGATNSASGTRAQRNNNPLNIKVSEHTASYTGVVGIDQSPASDGGNFLVFNTPEAGFSAATRLLQVPNYQNLTVDAAMKRWSNNGYGGEIAQQLAMKKVNQLTQSELNMLVQAMARQEGYYA